LGGVTEHGLGAWDMCLEGVSFWLLKTHMFAILIFEDSTFISTLFFLKILHHDVHRTHGKRAIDTI